MEGGMEGEMEDVFPSGGEGEGEVGSVCEVDLTLYKPFFPFSNESGDMSLSESLFIGDVPCKYSLSLL